MGEGDQGAQLVSHALGKASPWGRATRPGAQPLPGEPHTAPVSRADPWAGQGWEGSAYHCQALLHLERSHSKDIGH